MVNVGEAHLTPTLVVRLAFWRVGNPAEILGVVGDNQMVSGKEEGWGEKNRT